MTIKQTAIALTTAFAIAFGAYAQESATFHHVHLNVVDPAKTIKYYEKFFSGVPAKFRGASDAVLTDRSFLLLNKVEKPAEWKMISSIYHIGWGGVDGPGDFEWRDKEGMEWESPLAALGAEHYMYAYGPDKEVVEVWTGFRHHRFGHVHLFSEDVNAAKNWYREHLGLDASRDTPKPPKAPADLNAMQVFRYLWMSQVSTDNGVTINIFAKPHEDSVVWWNYDGIDELVPTDGRVVDHIAFSYPDIDPVFERMKKNGVEIVKPIAFNDEYKLKSFFVRGPDQILVEIVEARPVFGGEHE